MIPEYIPYIKYVISPGTRFERDKRVLFDPDGEVAQGKPLINYGWGPSGLKELVEALFKSRKEKPDGFEKLYNEKVLRCRRNIVDVLKEEGLIDEEFPALLRIKIKEGVEVPALLVNIDRMYFKRCDQCGQSWRLHGVPEDFVEFLKSVRLEEVTEIFQCSRQVCKLLCDNYDYCFRSYTSTEGDVKVEKEKLECLQELFKQITGISSGSKKYECILREKMPRKLSCRDLVKLPEELPSNYGTLIKLVHQADRVRCATCIERQLRFDFTPLRYFFFDYKTWSKMQEQRYSRKPMHNIDALPAKLLSEFIDSYKRYLDGTQLVAPIYHKGVLEAFLNVSNVKFELKHECEICGDTHRISGIPIKAMFRDSDVFRHEAYFADLLWNKLWEKHPIEFCKSFVGRAHIKISESAVLKREMKVEEIYPLSRFASSSYDYAVDLSKIGIKRVTFFDLTTGLWKKSGFHEVARPVEEYVEMWKELLFEIPKKKDDTYAVWYIVINSTEELFFDQTAPFNVKSMEELLDLITSKNMNNVIMIRSEQEIKLFDLKRHRLIVVPIFNTTQPKGEARWEIKRLENRKYEKLTIWNVVNRLFC